MWNLYIFPLPVDEKLYASRFGRAVISEADMAPAILRQRIFGRDLNGIVWPLGDHVYRDFGSLQPDTPTMVMVGFVLHSRKNRTVLAISLDPRSATERFVA